MRLLGFQCIILACIATTFATEQPRPKRDLQFWKEVIAAKLGLIAPKPVRKAEHIKIVQIPNHEEVVVRASPKVIFVQAPELNRILQLEPSAAIYGSLGTRIPEETLFSLQEMPARHEFIEIAPPKTPVNVLPSPVLQQRVDYPEPRPVYPFYKETVVPMPPPIYSRMPAVDSLPVEYLPPLPALSTPPARVIPVPPKIAVEEIRHVPSTPIISVSVPPIVRTEFVPTKYSYKQSHLDGSVTSYISEGIQEVIITETTKPIPPPPSFIIDRLQKIVYGDPLGHFVTEPHKIQADVIVAPVYTETLPTIAEPSSVKVKVNESNKKIAVTSTKPKPIAIDAPLTPVVIAPPNIVVEAPTSENGDQDRYKHVHADGTIQTYSATVSTKEPYDLISYEHISRLPPPPPELLNRIENAADKAHKPKAWGWGLKLSNGVGSYGSLGEGKIYYSHLEKPHSDIFPDPLSSFSSDKKKNPNSNMFIVPNEGEDYDKQPFLSTKVKDESNSGQREFDAMKKYPPLPMPIAGENGQSSHSQSTGAPYSYETGTKPNTQRMEIKKNYDHRGFGFDGFSYTQVNHDGSVDIFTGNERLTRPVLVFEGKKKISTLPGPFIKILQPTVKPPLATDVGEGHVPGFSDTKINSGSSVKTTSGGEKVISMHHAVPLQPVGVVDIIHPILNDPCKNNKICKKPHSGYSYTQVNNGGVISEITGSAHTKTPAISEVVNAPTPSAVVDFFQPVVEVPSSGFSYSQVNHGGLATKILGDSRPKVPAIKEIVNAPVAPSAVIDVIQPIPKPQHVNAPTPSAVVDFIQPALKPQNYVVEVPSSGFSYSQVNHGGLVTKILGDSRPKVPAIKEIVNAPVAPSAVIDVIQPIPKPQHATVEVPSSGFSNTKVKNGGLVNKVSGNGPLKTSTITEVVKVPMPPAMIVDVIGSQPNSKAVVVEASNKHSPGAVNFQKPVASNYVYKQISGNNPQPFTVVQVGEAPAIKVPPSDVNVKVNKIEHFITYGNIPCTELPKVAPDAPIPMIPTEKVVATIPSDLMYVPPIDAFAPPPTSHKVQLNDRHFSYTQLTSSSSIEGSSATTEEPAKISDQPARTNEEPPTTNEEPPITNDEPPIINEELYITNEEPLKTNEVLPEINKELPSTAEPDTSSNDEPISFDLNPIVVEDPKLDVQDDKNSDDESNISESTRGDLLEARS